MKVKERAVKTSHTNPIQDWYDTYNSISNRSNKNVRKYENGMLISISNNECYYEELFKTFKDAYISIIRALKGKDYEISKWDVRQ